MPKKPTNGGATVELLGNIWGELKAMRGDIDGLRKDVGVLRKDVDGLRSDMREGFDQLGRRIDNVLLGAHGREHVDLRERVARIERHLGFPPPGG